MNIIICYWPKLGSIFHNRNMRSVAAVVVVAADVHQVNQTFSVEDVKRGKLLWRLPSNQANQLVHLVVSMARSGHDFMGLCFGWHPTTISF